MEQRVHPRIQIPLLVELTHPALGTVQTIARDVSAGGMFVRLPEPQIKQESKIKLRLLTVLPIDTQPTPTVDMVVKRVAEDGLGLAFINRTAEHLWSSVQRLRNELEIGRDYFQVHQSVALLHADKGLLLVQQNGKWLLPGFYLLVGQSAVEATRDFVQEELGLRIRGGLQPLMADSAPDISITEAATYSIIFSAPVENQDVSLNKASEYKDWRWLKKVRDLHEITFASELQRSHAERLLEAPQSEDAI